MIERIWQAQMPIAWVVADTVYGGNLNLRTWLEVHGYPYVAVMHEEQKKSLDELLALLTPTSQQVIEFWLQFGGSYQDIAQAFDSDVRTIRTRFHRATQRLKNLVSARRIRESDLRQWLQTNLLLLEEEWEVWKRDFSLRDFIKGEAYANVFGGHPYRGQFMPEDDYVPDAFLPPSYWN